MKGDRENKSELIIILTSLFKWRWHIIIATLIVILASILFTSRIFITPLYSSELVLFPPQTFSSSSLINMDPRFGSEIDADQQLQIMNSNAVRDRVVEKFDLISHYDIDENRRNWKHQLIKTYNSHIDIRRTLNSSIRIRVRDKDAEMAAQIAEEIAGRADVFRTEIFKNNLQSSITSSETAYRNQLERVQEINKQFETKREANFNKDFSLKEQEYLEKMNTLTELRSRLNELRSRFNIHDFEQASELVSEKLIEVNAKLHQDSVFLNRIKAHYEASDTIIIHTEARISSTASLRSSLNRDLKQYTAVLTEYEALRDKIQQENEALQNIQEDYESLRRSFYTITSDFELSRLEAEFDSEFESLQDLRKEYIKARNNLNQEFLESYIVDSPVVTNRPAYPNRPLITIGSAIGALFLFSFLAVFFETALPKIYAQLKD